MCHYRMPEMIAALVGDGADRRTSGQHDPRREEREDVVTVPDAEPEVRASQHPSCAATPAAWLRSAAPTAAATVSS